MTYAIAYTDTAIWGTVPMTGDYMSALRAQVEEWQDRENPLWDTDKLRITTGVTLTDEVEDGDDEIFSSGNGSCGWIIDENGRAFEYAVLR